MEFGAPENLVLIWLVPLVVLVCFFAEKIRKKRLRLVGFIRDEPLGKQAPTSFFRWLVKTSMIAAAATCLVLAVAKPRWGFEWIDAKQRGADIIIAVDVSKSMLAPDVSPSRLERARRKVSDLLDRMSGDRVGLVAFAGTSFVQCPLTMDYGAVRLFLSYLDPDMIPTQGTDLGSAIDMSLAGLFEGAPEGTTTGRAIIIMTDGEDQEGRGLKAAEAAKAKGVKIYTMSIGSEEGTLIPEPGGGFKKDRTGNLVISKPNEPALRALSLATGGSHVRSVAGDGDIEALYDNGILKEIDRVENQEIRTKRWHERFQWFLAAAVLLLFLEPLVRDLRVSKKALKTERKPKAAQGVHALGLILFSLTALSFSERASAASMSEAHKYYSDKDYENAAKAFSELEKEEPENPEVTYNRAVSQYRNGDFQGAAEGFGRSAGSKDKALQEKSWYNLGNSLSYMQKFKEAVDAYENTLKLNPGNVKAKENLELVKKLLEQQKEQQKNNQNQNQDNKDEKEGEQQENQEKQDGQESKDQQQSEEQKGQEGQQKEQESGQEGDQSQQQNQDQKDQSGEPKPDEKKEGEEGQQNDADKKEEEGKGQDEQQTKSGDEEKNEKDKEAGESTDQTNHNQGTGKELKESKAYSAEQAKQLLRSVEDKIKKYRYMEQSGTSQNNDPEKDW